jgi:hypothetical protein
MATALTVKYVWSNAKERKLRALYRKVHHLKATRAEALQSMALAQEKSLAAGFGGAA